MEDRWGRGVKGYAGRKGGEGGGGRIRRSAVKKEKKNFDNANGHLFQIGKLSNNLRQAYTGCFKFIYKPFENFG